MTVLEYKALRMNLYAWALLGSFYILTPLLFVMCLINPDIGFRVAAKFKQLSEDLNEILAQLQAEQGIAPIVNRIM